MKTAQIILEDFGVPNADTPPPHTIGDIGTDTGEDIEAIRLAAYENGYKTGWDDGIKSCEEEGKSVAEELGRNLKDMDFTYFEAREELSKSLRTFLENLLAELFPQILGDAVARIVEDILSHADPAMSGQMEIAVSVEDATTVRDLLAKIDNGNASLVEEPALASGQAKVRINDTVCVVDADRIATRIKDALNADASTERLAANG